ncbi:unnamed protein product [Rotaria sordida]|uniref:Sterol 3-beta-glucosyltransferase n=2 Tax=Rotaria sordida TaxID=392033 RepID=A0A818JHJ4_9BILA|nr:unnamed protein product [Rotaria sordida]
MIDLKKDDERKEIISETYEHIRSLAIHLLNEQLNENFENAYQQWRWNNEKLSNYIYLNNERANILDNQTEFELENLSLRLAMRQVAEEKFVYKWTYSTAILYAATLVTTIGYGNISPKTTLGKISTVIYALIGILLVVSWLKLVGDSLALLVTQYYQYFSRCFRRHFKRKKIPLQEKIYLDEKVPFWVPITLLILYLLAGSVLFATWEGWSYIDSAYFSFITFTTIGFGDLVPGETTITHRNGRSLICAIYLLFGVMLTALSFKLIQEDIDRIKSCLFQRLGCILLETMTTIIDNDSKESTNIILFDHDWKYTYLTNSSSNEEFISMNCDDHQWKKINLPHYEITYDSLIYWYRKKFEWKQKSDFQQHIYLNFYSNEDEDNRQIYSIVIWLNETMIYSGNLPKSIQLTKYLRINSDNILAVCSTQGYTLSLHTRILIPHVCSGSIKYDDYNGNGSGRRLQTLDYTASFDDSDGLIDIFIDPLRKMKTATQHEQVDVNEDWECIHVVGSQQPETETILKTRPIPRLAILMLIVGTRGDVQPFIALAKALLSHGHRVRLATHEVFRTFVRENGIEFYPLAGNPADLMSFMVKNAGIVPSVSSIVAGDIAKSRRVIADILASTWKACIEDDDETGVSFIAEAIIANPPSYGHIHCAQKLQIPLHMIFTMPWSPTVQFPHPLCKIDYNRASIEKINFLSYHLVEVFTWSGMRSIINEFRKDTLGLSTLHIRQAVRLMLDEHVPHTYCWSPSLVPKPDDWPEHIDISGFFFLDLATNYKPPEDLMQFLKSGDPPIYIGFGSITGHDSERILQVVLEALRITGYRALFSGFDVDVDSLPDSVFRIGNCPHDWLFQHVTAVCHHGGAGTTAAGLRAGKPTIIVPFFGDQFFWGSVISKSGAGPPPIPGKSITAKQLAAAFTFVHDPKVQSAALKISSAFHHEHGCENAVRLFHTNLSLSKMHSDLESSFSACFRLKDYNLQISRPVAQVLVAAEAIEESQLTLLATHDWNKSMYVNRLESYASGFRRAISRFADSVRPSKRSSSVNYLERNSSCSTPHITKHNLINVGRPFKDNLPLYGDIKEQPPQEEYDENSKLAEKVKRGVHYDLPPTIVKKSSVHNRSRSTADAIPSSTINHFRKNNSKSRTTDNILPNSPYQNQRTRNIHSAKTNKKKQDLVLPKQKPILQLKDKNNSTSTEQKAADISGLSIDVCKKILADFKQIQSARRRSIDKSKHQMGISILPNSHRRRSQSSIVH